MSPSGEVLAARRLALGTAKRSIEVLRRLIDQNRRLAELPGHEESATRRVREGQAELRAWQAEEARLAAEVSEPDRE